MLKIIKNDPRSSRFKFDGTSGVYFLRLNRKIIYIGKSVNVFARIFAAHLRDKKFDDVEIHWMPADELLEYERRQIARHRPPLNDIECAARGHAWKRLNDRFKSI